MARMKNYFFFLAALAAPLTVPLSAQTPPSQPYVWRNVEIVGGGFVSGVVFHPKAPNVVYARTDIGGPYRLDTATQRWIPLTDFFGSKDWNLYGVESLALDPNDPKRVYLALGTYINDWAGNGAILRSADSGKTWQRTDLPFKNGGNWGGRSMGERLVVDPQNSANLFFGTRLNGLWKSSDSGATWANVETFPKILEGDADTKNIGIPIVFFGPDNSLYAAVSDRRANLYRSRDGGKTWFEVPGHPRGFLPHQAKFDSRGTLYITYSDTPGPNGIGNGAVWKMDAKTQKWTDITPLYPRQKDEPGFGYAGLAVDASRPGTLMVATICRWAKHDDIFRSTDGGQTWRSLNAFSERDSTVSPFLNWDKTKADLGHWIGDLEIDPFNANRAFYVTGATIWGTDNLRLMDKGRTTLWTPRAGGLEETAVQDVISPPQGAHLHSALLDIGGFRHDDFSKSPPPRKPIYGNTNSIDFAEKQPNIIVRSGAGKVAASYSLDGGLTWALVATQPEGTKGHGPIALSADGTTIAWTPNGAAPHISRDRGATWIASQGLKTGLSLVPDREDAQRFYTFDKESGTLFYSSDGGATFAPRATNLPTGDAKLRAAPGRTGHLWLCAGSKGLWRSTDGGATFQKIATVKSAETMGFGKAALGRDYHALYLTGDVGSVHGVFRSDDTGQSWIRINDDAHQYGWIGKVVIGDPRVYGRVYLGTNGRGILYADPIAGG
jgi:xyloglucan-specific exo-beta-1,4-glucanase